jgi:hypothetical protein
MLNPDKIERQARDGVIVVSWLIDPIPQLSCVLPAKVALARVDDAERQFRALTYPQLLDALRREFMTANQKQGDPVIIQMANILAVCAVLRNPLFGAEARVLLAEVRRHRRNLGFTVVCQEGQFAFGVGTGIANVARQMIGKPETPDRFDVPPGAASETWRTRFNPEATDAYSAPEMHVTLFEATNEPGGINHSVSLMIPETSPIERRLALNIAVKAAARTTFMCDTAEQAEAMAAYATPLLPGHRRVAYERAEAGQWGKLM